MWRSWVRIPSGPLARFKEAIDYQHLLKLVASNPKLSKINLKVLGYYPPTNPPTNDITLPNFLPIQMNILYLSKNLCSRLGITLARTINFFVGTGLDPCLPAGRCPPPQAVIMSKLLPLGGSGQLESCPYNNVETRFIASKNVET